MVYKNTMQKFAHTAIYIFFVLIVLLLSGCANGEKFLVRVFDNSSSLNIAEKSKLESVVKPYAEKIGADINIFIEKDVPDWKISQIANSSCIGELQNWYQTIFDTLFDMECDKGINITIVREKNLLMFRFGAEIVSRAEASGLIQGAQYKDVQAHFKKDSVIETTRLTIEAISDRLISEQDLAWHKKYLIRYLYSNDHAPSFGYNYKFLYDVTANTAPLLLNIAWNFSNSHSGISILSGVTFALFLLISLLVFGLIGQLFANDHEKSKYFWIVGLLSTTVILIVIFFTMLTLLTMLNSLRTEDIITLKYLGLSSDIISVSSVKVSIVFWQKILLLSLMFPVILGDSYLGMKIQKTIDT